MGFGYNIVRANPLAGALGDDSRDTGWAPSKVFDVVTPTSFSQERTIGGKFAVPDGVTVDGVQSCALAPDTAVITDGTLLQGNSAEIESLFERRRNMEMRFLEDKQEREEQLRRQMLLCSTTVSTTVGESAGADGAGGSG